MDAPRIWIPKLKIFEAGIACAPAVAEGFFVMEACNRYGQVKRSRTWKQLITNTGMAGLAAQTTGAANPLYCSVGTGSPTFSNSSTGLATFLARTSSTYSGPTNTNGGSGDGYAAIESVTKQFGLGDVVGNLTEVGFFSAADNTSGWYLDLIRDSEGNPTTFPVTVEDQLRVTHIIKRYPYLGDSTGSFNVGGAAGSGDHDYLIRLRAAGTSQFNSSYGGVLWGASYNLANNVVTTFRDATEANIVSITDTGSSPASGATSLGTVSSATNGSPATADNVTWTRNSSITMGLTNSNHANGISGIQTQRVNIIITPAIPKYAGSVQRILTLNFAGAFTRG